METVDFGWFKEGVGEMKVIDRVILRASKKLILEALNEWAKQNLIAQCEVINVEASNDSEEFQIEIVTRKE